MILFWKRRDRPAAISRRARVFIGWSAVLRYTGRAPIIAVFFGIIVRMFYREHEPAHFHAEHQGDHAKFDFDGKLIAREMHSRKARGFIRQWAKSHRRELEVNWEKMRAGQALGSHFETESPQPFPSLLGVRVQSRRGSPLN